MQDLDSIYKAFLYFLIPGVACAITAAVIFTTRPGAINQQTSLEKLLVDRADQERTQKMMKKRNEALAAAIEAGDDETVEEIDNVTVARQGNRKTSRKSVTPAKKASAKPAAAALAQQQALPLEPDTHAPYWGHDDGDWDIPEMHGHRTDSGSTGAPQHQAA